MNRPSNASATRILVWDLPTRVFHWLLAATFGLAWLTAESERLRDLHVLLGYTFAGLIVFRLLWGVLGTRYARFASFAAGPQRVLAYLRSLARLAPEHHIGHNPAGGWAIFALLGLGLVTALSGYAAYNDIGPRWIEELHEGLAGAMLALVALHVAAVAVSSLLHRENLLRAMWNGHKKGTAPQGIRSPRRFAGFALAATVIAFWAAALGGALPQVLQPSPNAVEARQQERHAHPDRRGRHADRPRPAERS